MELAWSLAAQPTRICTSTGFVKSGFLSSFWFFFRYACGATAHPCRESCWYSGRCNSGWASNNHSFTHLPQGTYCGPSSYCDAFGSCIFSLTYAWEYAAWSPCTASCTGTTSGTQTRSAVCRGSDGQVYDNSKCDGAPVIEQSCSALPCNFTWKQIAIGSCSAACGGGTINYNVYCSESRAPTTAVDGLFCNGPAPATSNTCNTGACQSRWTFSSWGECTKICGSGTRSRTVQCQTRSSSSSAWTNSAESACSSLAKPSTIQSCNTSTCPNPHWEYIAWSTCSKTCGGGVQTRTVSCVNKSGQIVSRTQCRTTAPVSSRSCNSQSC